MVNCSMNQNDRDEAVDGPVVSEGGRSPSTLSPGQGSPAAKGGAGLGPLAPGQRWSAVRKREVVLELGLPLFKLEQWRQTAEAGLEGALKEREADPAGDELAAAMQRIGELSMEVELLRAKMGRTSGLLARRRWRGWPPPARPPPAGTTASRVSARSGTCRAPPSTPLARLPPPPAAQSCLLAADQSRRSPTTPCSPPSRTTSPARPGPARGTERSGPACG